MPHHHDDFQTEPVRGLPEALPKDEHILWQGAPNWWALTTEALSLWWVVGYFFALFVWRTVGGAATETWVSSATAASFFLVLGGIVCALLIAVGFIQAKATVYTITNKRVAMRIGAALTLTLNVPFRQIENATLARRKNGTGTIALSLMGGNRPLSYVMTWPHVRPWRMRRVEPALRCIPDAARVAAILADAAEKAVATPVIERVTPMPGAGVHTPIPVAAE